MQGIFLRRELAQPQSHSIDAIIQSQQVFQIEKVCSQNSTTFDLIRFFDSIKKVMVKLGLTKLGSACNKTCSC